MKKVIGILGIAVFAAGLFINANTVKKSSEMNLVNLLSLNEASAECRGGVVMNGECNFTGERCYWRFEGPYDCSTLTSY